VTTFDFEAEMDAESYDAILRDREENVPRDLDQFLDASHFDAPPIAHDEDRGYGCCVGCGEREYERARDECWVEVDG
jgi:hypothetical protein